MNLTDLFIINFQDDPEDLHRYWEDAIGLIHTEAVEKGIEFDGYFQSKWADAADTITQFNEAYFADENRRKLYVYLSAIADDEIYSYLKDAYNVVGETEPSKETLKIWSDQIILNGSSF